MRGMKRADLRGALAALRAISSNSGIGYREEKGIGQTLRPANLSLQTRFDCFSECRGLHFQWDQPMGKLMRVTAGTAFLVAVDIRKGSATLGKWVGLEVFRGKHEAGLGARRLRSRVLCT